MSLFQRLLWLFTRLRSVWPLAIARSSGWWTTLLAFCGWRSAPTAGAAQNDETASKAPGAAAIKNLTDRQKDEKPQGRPKVIRHRDVAGEWERALHPDWPEWRFQIPKDVPYGTIYHVRKGRDVGFGTTAYLEVTLDEHVVKTPKNNPYDVREEERNLENMRAEAEVYRRIGPGCPYVPKMIAWDPATCCLTMEYLKHSTIENYMTGLELPGYTQNEPPAITPPLRRRWALQVTRGLQALHANNIIHADLTPRNVLLGADMNVRIADFAGSSTDGAPYKICAGERYLVPGWSFRKTPEPADDVFLLGGVLYFIMTGNEPHHDIKSEFDVAKLYAAGTFPDVTGLDGGAVIQGCWDRSWTTADAVLEQLLLAFGTDDDPFTVATQGA